MDVKALEAQVDEIQEVDARLELLEKIAGHYYDRDDYRQALKFYGEAEKLAPEGNVRAFYSGQKGICHYFLQEDSEAEQALLRCKRLSQPGAPEFSPEVYGLAHYFLGSLYEYRGEPDASLRERKEALKFLDHLHREVQWMLLAGMSRNYEEKGDHRKAVKCNTKALSLIGRDDPELADLYESLGLNYFELGEYQEALSYFGRVLESNPDFERKDDIYLLIGRCCKKRLDFQMALHSYLKILELKQLNSPQDGSLAWLYIEIASCLYHLKDFRKGLQYVEEAMARPNLEPQELAELRSYLTNCNHALGRYELATAEGEKTLAICPRFPGMDLMLPNLALSYYKLNDKKNFLRCRELCNREFPDLGWTRQLNKLAV